MRANLLHKRERPRHGRGVRRGLASREPQRKVGVPSRPEGDAAVQRAREAGGPLDLACYVCSCGYLFDAAVSTSVSCPHCGAEQAW